MKIQSFSPQSFSTTAPGPFLGWKGRNSPNFSGFFCGDPRLNPGSGGEEMSFLFAFWYLIKTKKNPEEESREREKRCQNLDLSTLGWFHTEYFSILPKTSPKNTRARFFLGELKSSFPLLEFFGASSSPHQSPRGHPELIFNQGQNSRRIWPKYPIPTPTEPLE